MRGAELERRLSKFMETIKSLKGFDRVEFILFHGSVAEGRGLPESDLDFCVYYNGNSKEQSDFRYMVLGKVSQDYDLQIFQELPLYVRVEALKGRVLYARNKLFLYDTALNTVREYESFRPHLLEYVGG